ncbi:MAG: DUF4239 domain-containing protein [Verrucomicrobiota bacterium]
MFEFLFDYPLWIAGLVIIGSLCVFALAGLLLVRRLLLPRLRIRVEDSEFIGTLVQAVMVFYGLAVALIAVSVWQTYSDVSKSISDEATTLAALYRDVSCFPEPVRSHLQGELSEYTRYIIHQAWPIQSRGQVPTGGVQRMNVFQQTMVALEPVTESQKIVFAEAYRAYNVMIIARRMRLDAVATKLPGMLWSVVIVGAFIGLSTTFFFKVEDVRLHSIQVSLLATFMGLVIFMIFALDRPFRGDLGLSPQPYQLVYDQLMKPAR